MLKRLLFIMIICMALLVAGCSPSYQANPDGVNRRDSAAPEPLRFSELYGQSTVRGLRFSDKLNELTGQTVVMKGYMAPPLKPSLDFFVLASQPMSICPFCDSDASWPTDIVLVYMGKDKTIIATTSPIEVTGRLETGSYTDENTGFVSQIRIYADKVVPLQ
ncbi:hypothetical protein FACS1894184_08840 [Clostridia bacterium]|nr:hypothetical protein FACS1894184_08840 [Clostridia bacterium]